VSAVVAAFVAHYGQEFEPLLVQDTPEREPFREGDLRRVFRGAAVVEDRS